MGGSITLSEPYFSFNPRVVPKIPLGSVAPNPKQITLSSIDIAVFKASLIASTKVISLFFLFIIFLNINFHMLLPD